MATLFDRSIICPVLIGRASTLQTLHTLIEQAKAKSGGMILISGEAGVGKSRLVAEAKSYARQQGFASLQGNCFQPDVAYPYAPLIDLLRHAFATDHGAQQMQLSPTSLRQLSRLLPDLFPPPETITGAITGAITEAEQDKYRLFAALLQVFAALAAQQPLLVTIEDVHWSDNISLEFLHQLARWSTTQPLLVLVTYRNDEIGASLSRWLAQLDREHLIREVALTPLNPSEVGELIKAIFELRRPVRTDFLETIQLLTEGNPFFVEEVLKSLILAGDIFYSNDTWDRKALNELHIPRSVQDAVQQRVEQLSPTAKQLIVIAAAAGRRFDFALLRALTEQDEYELISAIKEMIGAQLVVEESAERFAFRHALTRQAIYADLLFRERVLLHQRIAEALQNIYATAPDSHLAELAYHFYEAKQWQAAFEICWRAGEQARRLYCFPSAAEHFTHALEALKQLEISAPLALLQARGLAYEAQGDFELARIDHERVIEMAQAAGDRQVECQAYLDLGMLWASQDYGKTGPYYRQALQLAREVEDSSLIAHSLNRVGNWYMNRDQHIEGQKYHQEALLLFQELDDTAGRAMTLDMLGLARYGSGDALQAAHDLEQASELFQKLKDRASLASSLTMLMLCRRETYETATVITAVDDSAKTAAMEELAYQISYEIGWPSREAFTLFEIGVSAGVRGDYGRAFAMTEKGLRMVEEIEHQQWMTLGYRVLAAIYLDLLAFSEAERHLQQALALAHKIGSLFFGNLACGLLASLYVREHQFEKAERILSALLPTDLLVNPDGGLKSASIYPSLGLRIAWSARAELALATHHPEVALAIVEALIASLANNASQNPPPFLLKLKGEALAGLQRWLEAQSALENARQQATERGLRSRLWRIDIALGNLFQAQNRQGEAEDAWFAARQLIAELSTEISDVALRENFVRRAKAMMPEAKPPRSARAVEKTLNGLTAREREVAALIAEGKSNQEIADSLVVGYRTVETHVSHILSKLGFSTRSQIARWALENEGLPRSDENG